MPPPFRPLNLAEFTALIQRFPFTRRVDSVHMHHTWRPDHSQYRGHESVAAMWRFHTEVNGWSDIAQHITIAPDGTIWTGRDWNQPPASAAGHNGNFAAGPFMFELVGDFDVGRDQWGGAQKQTALAVIALVQARFNLPRESLRFHNQMGPKSCPGSQIDYQQTLQEVRSVREEGAAPEMETMRYQPRVVRQRPRIPGMIPRSHIHFELSVLGAMSSLLGLGDGGSPSFTDPADAEPAESEMASDHLTMLVDGV